MLFFKECKKILLSLTFLIYVIAVFAMYYTQFQGDCDSPLEKPLPNQSDYGMVVKEVPEILMPSAIDSLVNRYLSNSYPAYPMGFYKDVHLNEKKKNKMAEIITEVSGITKQELDNFTYSEEDTMTVGENGMMQYNEPEIPSVNIPESLTYERFRELMDEADKIIGGGSEYSDEYILENFSLVPKTYEDALEEYNKFLNDDKITGAYARLYCDYMGIVLAILPVFVAVSFTSLDRKSRMEQLAYSRKISSAKLVFTRYVSLVFMMIIPVLITAFIAHMTVKKLYPEISIDNSAIIKNAMTWLVPNIMFSTAVGMIITELSSGIIAIFIQGALWFGSIFAGTGSLTGNIHRFTLVLRHNSLYGADVFQTKLFVFNRIFFTVLSLTIILITAFIYEQKRGGKLNGLNISFKNLKNKPET